jgi:hypothetical protein
MTDLVNIPMGRDWIPPYFTLTGLLCYTNTVPTRHNME